MLKFRKKILFLDLALFLVFIAVLFPFVDWSVGNIMRKSLEKRAKYLIGRIDAAPDLEAMLQKMREEALSFQGATLYNSAQEVLFDLSQKAVIDPLQPEIQNAILYGKGYSKRFSKAYQEPFSYFAILFKSHEQKYILRTGMPLEEIKGLTSDFKFGFFLLGTFILMLYGLMTGVIVHRLSAPIQQVIDAITPYQEGKVEFPPQITLNQSPTGEFSKLAFTLNSLTGRIQRQIENLTQQRRETEGILESLGEGVIALDTEAKVTFANRVACRMLGVSHEALIGQPLQKIASTPLLKKSHELVLQALQTSESVSQTLKLEDRTYLEMISTPLTHPHGVTLVLQDKTSDYKILEMGKDFVANASHELRTPITIIRGFAETLLDLPHLSRKMLAEITEKIVRTCGRLDGLVKSLLTITDIENVSEERFRPCDLVSLVDNCCHTLQTAHPSVQLAVLPSVEHLVIQADSDLVELAVMNLLENAVKYSVAPAKITLALTKEEKGVSLTVQDCGIGIPESDLPHIFDRFYTVDKARTRKAGGVGLGLSIVKTVMEKHKGGVSAHSELGKGSSFTLTLPV